MNIKDVASNFKINGTLLAYNNYGCGHINDTYCLTYIDGGETKKYILQRLNQTVFPDIDNLMANVINVTEFIQKKLIEQGRDPYRECITIIPTRLGKAYYSDNEGNYWRATLLIDNTEAYQIAVDNTIFEKTGKAFGEFIRMLEDFPVESLYEIIEGFHDTRKRFDSFIRVLKDNPVKRRRYCRKEINFVREHENKCSKIVDMLEDGTLPLRVTHNDTKINNILIDTRTGDAVCVIDLDTIMPGSLLYDFGDGIRSGCNTASEDEKDLNKVNFDMEKFTYFTKGFLDGIGDSITQTEKDNLAYAATLITFECGIRFLTDYLNGDKYFKTAYSNHNLIRARTQFKLVEEMSDKLNEMNEIISNL